MSPSEFSVILRLPEQVGISYWCLKVDPARGRPDLAPERSWNDMEVGDKVVAADGTVYEVDRLAPADAPEARDGVLLSLPECREAIERLSTRSVLSAVPR